jgi:hypothetical protein
VSALSGEYVSKKRREPLFFNFALKDGHFMSRPVFNPQQSLIGELIHSLERFKPRFAWIQFLFGQRDYNHLFMHTKSELEAYIQFAKTEEYDVRTRQRIPKKELHTQWNKLAPARIKKIEQTLSRVTVIFAINGLWVAGEQKTGIDSEAQLHELPLSFCSDDLDRLRAFTYRDPRILRLLLERRMVTNISSSIYRYSRSREEPPSLILTPDEIPFYVHMPTGASAKGLSSTKPAAHFPLGGTLKSDRAYRSSSLGGANRSGLARGGSGLDSSYSNGTSGIQETSQARELLSKREGNVEGQVARKSGPVVAVLKKLPTLEAPLSDDEAKRLSNLVSRNVRTFEILYDSQGSLDERFNAKATTTMLLSSSGQSQVDDLERVYIPQLESVYGRLDYELLEDTRPKFVMQELPRLVG